MQMYLAMIQNNLCSAVILGAAGVLIASLIVFLALRARYRKQTDQLNLELTQARITHDQFIASQQHLENALQLAENDIGHHTQQAAALFDTLANALGREENPSLNADDDIWQGLANAQTRLIGRLHDLQDKRQALETQVEILNHANDEQLERIADMEQSFVEQQVLQSVLEESLEKLKAKNLAHKADAHRLELARMQVFNELNMSAKEIRRLRAALADNENTKLRLAAEIRNNNIKISELETALAMSEQPAVASGPIAPALPEPTPIPATQASPESGPNTPLPDHELPELAESLKQPQQLFTKFINSIKSDLHLGKKTALPAENVASEALVDNPLASEEERQAAIIQKLEQELLAQKNHIGRLEYDLEVKELLLKDRHHEIHSVPVTIAEKQAADEARIIELETKLFGKSQITPRKAIQASAAPGPKFQTLWFNPFKKQISPAQPIESAAESVENSENITDKTVETEEASFGTKPFPSQIKGFYQKIAAFTAH